MNKLHFSKAYVAKIAVRACMLPAVMSCVHFAPPTSFSRAEGGGGLAYRDSLQAVMDECSRLKRENEELKSNLKSKILHLAKVQSELEKQTTRNQYLEEELDNVRNDLEYVEKQFVSFEKHLQSAETKASAVAAQAETKMALDKLLSKGPDSGPDSLTIRLVEEKLLESDELLKNKKYAAAIYYAKRALRIIEQEARMEIAYADLGDTRVVSVENANIRSGPGTDFEVVGRLPFGTIIIQFDQNGDWSRIKTQDGKEGWIHRGLIK